MFKLTGTSTPLAAPPKPPPQLADGVELIGEYQDSGFKEAPCLVRLPGGNIVQMPRLLFAVAAAIDGTRDLAAIAAEVREELQLALTPEQVQFLLDHRLRPLGVLDGTPHAGDPLDAAPLAFTLRKAFVPASAVRALAALLRHFFRPTMVGAAVAWLVVLDVWLYFEHGLGPAVRVLLEHPLLMLLVFGLLIASTIFHELGHAAACRYGGARPGAIGAGLYYVWPAFFTDVTDAYRLDRRGRLRTDLGGIYFNVLFMLGVAVVYYRTHYEPLLVFVAVQHVQILNQFIPWVRLDGYYVLTDLTGVPDVLTRVKAVLLSLIPDRKSDPSVAELKPWVRTVLTVYVVTLIPVLAFTIAMLVVHAPRFLAFAFTSLQARGDEVATAAAHGDFAGAVLAAVQFVALLLPALGMTLTLVRIVRAVLRRLVGRRRVKIALALATAGFVLTAGFAAAPAAEQAQWHATKPVRTFEGGARSQSSVRQRASSGRPDITATTRSGAVRTGATSGGPQPFSVTTTRSPTEGEGTQSTETFEITTEPEPPTTEPPPTTAPATTGTTTTTTTPTTTAPPPPPTP
jgi:putative peptide zinc metalloprotease protein